MNDELRIRRATPTDAARIAALWDDALPRAWSEPAVQRVLAGPRGAAWLSGEIAAFLLAEQSVDRFEVLAVAVARGQRRRGIGASLLDRAVVEARTRGCERVELEVAEHNVAARALYAAHQFVAVGRRPRYYGGREDAVLMTRELSLEH